MVFTTLQSLEWNNSTLLTGDVAEQLSKLRQQPGMDISVTGSATLVGWLLREGLLEELRLLLHPIVVGTGLLARSLPAVLWRGTLPPWRGDTDGRDPGGGRHGKPPGGPAAADAQPERYRQAAPSGRPPRSRLLQVLAVAAAPRAVPAAGVTRAAISVPVDVDAAVDAATMLTARHERVERQFAADEATEPRDDARVRVLMQAMGQHARDARALLVPALRRLWGTQTRT